MIENQKDLVCSKKHNGQPIVSVLINHQIPVSQRLQCATCITESKGQFFSISFNDAKNIVFQKQEKLQEILNESTKKTLEQLSSFKQKVDKIKSNIIQQFDALLKNSEEWSNNLVEFNKQRLQYSLLDEIEHLDESINYSEEKLKYEFNYFNYSYHKKIETMFQLDILFKNILSIKEAIDEVYNRNISQVQWMPQKSIEIKKYNENNTPHFVCKCTKHNSEIIYVDLRKNIKKEERLKCINCKKEDSVTVMQFLQQWDQYYHGIQQSIIIKQCDQQKRLEKIKRDINSFIVDLAKIISNALLVIENNRNFSLDNNQQIDTSLEVQLISKAEQLSQANLTAKREEEEKEKMNEESLNKLNNLSQYLIKSFENFQIERMETINQKNNISKTQTTSMTTYNKISNQMIEQIKQQEYCFAIAFNYDGSIMAAAFNKDIKIWKFENGKLEKTETMLQGHTNGVQCLVYSKSRNWIASGGQDYIIRLWKDMGNNQWSSSEPGKVHTNTIYCLLMNEREDQLISGSRDNSIKIWKINYETNQLNYEYSLDKHSHYVYSISLNESETTLVSCSQDQQILIWGKGQNQKWEFKDTIIKSVNDYGKRICFINDQTIAWQQFSQGYTHIFKLENGKFIEKPELQIQLKQVGSDGVCLFPAVFNKSKQLLIQKHNQYVYIISLQQDGKFKIECDPIDCNSNFNYGALTNDGQYLVIWNDATTEFRVYRLIYV